MNSIVYAYTAVNTYALYMKTKHNTKLKVKILTTSSSWSNIFPPPIHDGEL